ncbi:MAG: hypothetical protein S4CHLAM102_11550 [Chlamydiia bacterium]|nr:hypothetical protein [Chlamydiia bacterium]
MNGGLRVRGKFLVLFLSALVALSIYHYKSPSHSNKGMVKYANLYPKTAILVEREDYAVEFDTARKVPNWTFEHLTKKSLAKQMQKKGGETFHADSHIPPHFQTSNIDFYKTGYDRGHMAAAANHAQSKRLYKETFYLSNVAPQEPGFNRFYWRSLEEYVRRLTKDYDDVYVVSGTTFLHKDRLDSVGRKIRTITYEVIGKNQVSVPNAFYKVILAKSKKGTSLYQAFCLPNEYIEGDPPFEKYQIGIRELERLTGSSFFPDEAKPTSPHESLSFHFSAFDEM